ncbi:MAG TPA: amidohydrolase family protein [Candidatus Methylomirabilis sp.]|nr:amidohydrolase family protein [Candidatus Methylomirabilis sp.]HSC71170.1 amidohydrolase family protein [Candidatus Methylomirabilis sp.]
MIVDMHRHLWSVFERHPSASHLFTRRFGSPGGQEVTLDAERRAADVLAEMDEAGIGRTVIVVADFALRLGEGLFAIEEENRLVAGLGRSHAGRILPFLGVDPRRPGALELFRKGLDEWGMAGLKLHPASGFFPYDPVCLPLFDLAGQRGVPVLVHTGPMVAPLLSRMAQPVHLDEVAADFPRTTIIMAHVGLCWWEEALSIAWHKPNVVLELSTWQWTFLRDPREFVRAVATMKDSIGAERIVFGSDFPALRGAMSLRSWVEVFQGLPDLAREHGHRISDSEAQAILGGNAERLLHLGDS